MKYFILGLIVLLCSVQVCFGAQSATLRDGSGKEVGTSTSPLYVNFTGNVTIPGNFTMTNGTSIRPSADGTTAFSIRSLGGTAEIVVDTEGHNVGIGRTPAAKLDVDGQAWLRGSAGGTVGLFVSSTAVEMGAHVSAGTSVFLGVPPAAQTIAAGNTVTANACGTIKMITAAGAVTTDTTNTFTAPATANGGCVMCVVNVGANAITLDNNALFVSAGAADVVLGAGDSCVVASSGDSGKWYQIGDTGNN